MGGLPEPATPVYGGGDMTLKEYIVHWQEVYDKNQSRPTTYAAHGYLFKNHILPGLGDIPLEKLTTKQVGDFLEERKHFGGHRPESPEYLSLIHILCLLTSRAGLSLPAGPDESGSVHRSRGSPNPESRSCLLYTSLINGFKYLLH